MYTQHAATPSWQQDIKANKSHRLFARPLRAPFTHSMPPNPHATNTSTHYCCTLHWHSKPKHCLHTAGMPTKHEYKIFKPCWHSHPEQNLHTAHSHTRMTGTHRNILPALIGTATPNTTYAQHAAKPTCQEDIPRKNRRTRKSQFPSIFDAQSRDRRIGFTIAGNRIFLSVFDTQSPGRRRGLPKKGSIALAPPKVDRRAEKRREEKRRCKMRRRKMRRCKMRRRKMRRCKMRRCKMRRRKMRRCKMRRRKMRRCKMRRCKMRRRKMRRCKMRRCKLRRCKLRRCKMRRCKLRRCKVSSSSFFFRKTFAVALGKNWCCIKDWEMPNMRRVLRGMRSALRVLYQGLLWNIFGIWYIFLGLIKIGKININSL